VLTFFGVLAACSSSTRAPSRLLWHLPGAGGGDAGVQKKSAKAYTKTREKSPVNADFAENVAAAGDPVVRREPSTGTFAALSDAVPGYLRLARPALHRALLSRSCRPVHAQARSSLVLATAKSATATLKEVR